MFINAVKVIDLKIFFGLIWYTILISLVKNESIGTLVLEMGLDKWLIVSKHSEKIRTDLTSLGGLFEAFIGAIFLDFNHLSIQDTNGWFDTVFSSGPGFQMAQIFIESVFRKHDAWLMKMSESENYKTLILLL